MAKDTFQVTFTTNLRTSSPIYNAIIIPFEADQTYTDLTIRLNSPVLAGRGAVKFKLSLNGVQMFDPETETLIDEGDSVVTLTGQTITVVKGDVLTVDKIGYGNLSIPVSIAFQADLASGGASDLDDLGDVIISTPTTGEVLKYNGTNWVNDTDAGGGGIPTPTVIFDDPFTGGTIDSAIWTTPSGGTSQGSGKLTITASSHEQLTSKSSILIDPTIKDPSWHNKQITAKMPTIPSPSGSTAAQFFISYASTLGTYYRGFQVYNGNLTAMAQGQTLSKSVTYNGTNHLWLRVRDLNSLTTFWTSANGTDWKFFFAAEPNIGGLVDAYNPFYVVLRLYNASGGSATVEYDSVKLEDLDVWFPN